MASFKTILSDIGHALAKVFGAGVTAVATVAQEAEPLVDLAFPGIAALYNSTVAEVLKAEALASAAGQQTGSGPQKLAIAVAAITPTFNAYAAANGLGVPAVSTIENYVNATVASLNAIPAATLSTS
jgi:hypothetical protein